MENNFQTEFEYWQNEVKNALTDWLEETEKYHKGENGVNSDF